MSMNANNKASSRRQQQPPRPSTPVMQGPVNNAVEAADLDLSKLAFGPQRNVNNATFAEVQQDGKQLLIKLRKAAVTVAPMTDRFNNLKFDIKLPDDQQGSMLAALNDFLGNPDSYPNLALPHAVNMTPYAYNQWLIPKSAIYGSNARFMSLKLKGDPLVVRAGEEGKVAEVIQLEDVRKGDEIDLVLSVLLYMHLDDSDESMSYSAGWSFKVHQIKTYPRRAKAEQREAAVMTDIL